MSQLSIWKLHKHQMNPFGANSPLRIAMHLSHSITVSSMTRYPNERPPDSSQHNLSSPPISPIINKQNKVWPQRLVSHTTVGFTSTKPPVSRTE